MQQIFVGQLVHYVASETAPYPRRRYPAIVVHLEDADAGIVNLTVFNDVTPTGTVSRQRVAYSSEHRAGSWHFPPTGWPGYGGTSPGPEIDL